MSALLTQQQYDKQFEQLEAQCKTLHPTLEDKKTELVRLQDMNDVLMEAIIVKGLNDLDEQAFALRDPVLHQQVTDVNMKIIVLKDCIKDQQRMKLIQVGLAGGFSYLIASKQFDMSKNKALVISSIIGGLVYQTR